MGDTIIKETDNVASWVTIVIVIVFLIIFILMRVLCGRVLRDIAIKKGYREKYWWWLGFLFNIFFGILVLFIVSHIKERNCCHANPLQSNITSDCFYESFYESDNSIPTIKLTNDINKDSSSTTGVDESNENITNNNIIVFKIANYQTMNESKLIDRIMKIEHVTNVDISSVGVITCYYDDTIKTPSDVASLKELIKSQITK